MANIKDNSIMLYSITFFREDENTGEQICYDYDGDCSWICDDIDESQLVEIKPNPDLAAIARNKLIAKKEQLKKEKVVEFKIQWCVDDVRHRLDVEHMTDEEIYEQLDDITDDMHDMAIESGWETMEHCFKIKGENND